MEVEIKTNQFNDFHNSVVESIPIRSRGLEHKMILPSELGNGFLYRILIRDGLELQISDVTWNENCCFYMDIGYPHLELSFNLAGGYEWSVKGIRRELTATAGNTNLIYLNDRKIYAEQQRNERMLQMEVRMDLNKWHHLITESKLDLNQSFCQYQQFMGPKIQNTIQQMLDCSYTGEIKQLYMEGKTLELVSIFMNELKNEKKQSALLKKADIQQIHLARDLLLQMLDHPPSLVGLARQVGINDHKLKIGFKEVFGTTVFEFIRQTRMEKARLLLEKGEVTVSEAALFVGYSNFSHFAKLFRKTFGFNPSEYRKNPIEQCKVALPK